jgi:MFS family permease
VSKATARILLALCLATAAWSFSFGLGTQLTTHWLKHRQATDAVIGYNHSTYYLGLALASLAVPWLTRRLGHRCSAVGMLLSGASLALFPLGDHPVGWFVFRFVNGMAGALSLVPLETMVSRDSPPDKRARNFSFYAVALTLGAAVGIWAGNRFFEPEAVLPFVWGGCLPAAAGLALFRVLPRAAARAPGPAPREPVDWSRDFLSYGTAWFQGFLEGGMLAFLSLYLITLGMSQDAAGGLMGVTMVGVILFQVPVAWLADRLGRLPVLLGCYTVVAAGLTLMPIWSPSMGLAICLFLLGACSGALYPLALAMLGERLPPAGLARAYSVFLAMECIGSQAGAAAMGQARHWWGEASMFAVGLAALTLVLGTWAVLVVVRGPRPTAGQEADLQVDHEMAESR